MQNPYPSDAEVYHVKGWIIRYSPSQKTLYLSQPLGRIFIIKPDTHTIAHIPQYLKEWLDKKGLLKTWREAQRQKALDRLKAIHVTTEKTDDKSWLEI